MGQQVIGVRIGGTVIRIIGGMVSSASSQIAALQVPHLGRQPVGIRRRSMILKK